MYKFNEDQFEALQEIANIAMGKAGSSLADILEVFVELSIPKINYTEVANVGKAIADMVGQDCVVTAVRQAFHKDLRGEAIVTFEGERDNHGIITVIGNNDDGSESPIEESILEISNLLVGAYLCGIGEQLGVEIGFSAPESIGWDVRLSDVIDPGSVQWRHALLVEINFGIKDQEFKSHLFVLMAEDGIQKLSSSIDRFLESLGV